MQNSETSEDDLEIKPSSAKKTSFIKPERQIPTEELRSRDSEGSESSVSKRNYSEGLFKNLSTFKKYNRYLQNLKKGKKEYHDTDFSINFFLSLSFISL